MKKKPPSSDFRYSTGAARIPWAAIGEPVRERDVLELVRFLLPPAAGRAKAYAAKLKRLAAALGELRRNSSTVGKLSLGPRVKAVEQQAARMLKAKHALLVTNATAGFEIAYQFAGLKPGDEVIAPAITFIATIAYPLSIGARVVLADIDPRTLNIAPADVARKITRRTKVIIPVHIGGYPADMGPIMRLARRHHITVIEDAAHAFGATYRGRMVGTLGHFGAFSFHEVKNITSLGEGGLLVTDLPCGRNFGKARFLALDLGRKIRNWLYDVVALKGRGGPFAAGNHSATEIQALGLSLQMKRLEAVIAKRRRAAVYLTRRLAGVDGLVTPPADTARTRGTHHLYLLRVDPARAGGDVQVLKRRLTEKGVVNIPHFAPLYKFSVMKQLGYDTAAIQRTCPNAEEVFNRQFTHLPLYGLTPADLKYMADAVIEAVNEMKAGK